MELLCTATEQLELADEKQAPRNAPSARTAIPSAFPEVLEKSADTTFATDHAATYPPRETSTGPTPRPQG